MSSSLTMRPQTHGPMAGDSTILSLQTRLRSIVTVDGLNEGFNALVLVGINLTAQAVCKLMRSSDGSLNETSKMRKLLLLKVMLQMMKLIMSLLTHELQPELQRCRYSGSFCSFAHWQRGIRRSAQPRPDVRDHR